MSSLFLLIEQAGFFLNQLPRNAAILLDDVVVLSKPALSRVGDAIALSKPAINKASAVVVDDTAVCSDQLSESAIEQHREYAVWRKIVASSLANKVLITALIVGTSALLPVLPQIMLVLGAGYLAYEGGHKSLEYMQTIANRVRRACGVSSVSTSHRVERHVDAKDCITPKQEAPTKKSKKRTLWDRFLGHDPKERAVLTDLILLDAILSTEILLVANGTFGAVGAIEQVVALGVVGSATTLGVYGVVLGIIRADNVASYFADPSSRLHMPRLAKGIMKSLPRALNVIGLIGTVAMLRVAGDVTSHVVPDVLTRFGAPALAHATHEVCAAVSHAMAFLPGIGPTLGSMGVGLLVGTALVGGPVSLLRAARWTRRAIKLLVARSGLLVQALGTAGGRKMGEETKSEARPQVPSCDVSCGLGPDDVPPAPTMASSTYRPASTTPVQSVDSESPRFGSTACVDSGPIRRAGPSCHAQARLSGNDDVS